MTTERLQELGGRFSYDADAAHTLSARYYYEPAVYERERERIFMRNWSYVCHRSQVAEPGSYVTCNVAGVSIVVVRDRDGTLRGFHNVCRHRGHELLSGSGRLAATITCPYHAWAYGLNGDLKAARNGNCVQGFNRDDFSLAPVRVEEFCTFVFVNPEMNAVPLAVQAAAVEKQLREWAPKLDRLTFAHRLEVPVAANWKAAADNFLECYHCEYTHKALVEGVNDMSSYEVRTGDIWSSHITTRTGASDTAYSHNAEDHGFVGFFLWPNTTLAVYPGAPNMVNHMFRPAGPGECVQVFDFLFETAEPTAEQRELIAYIRDVLMPEDNALVEGVQRGLRSPAYLQGRLMVDAARGHMSEHAVHHFQGLVLDALEGGNSKGTMRDVR